MNSLLCRARRSLFIIGILLMTFVLVGPTNGQEGEPELLINLDREVGFSFGGRIQGTFSVVASGPADLSRVVFKVDDASIGTDDTHPYRLRISTGDYPVGRHTFRAVGFLSDGSSVLSNEISRDFIPGNLVYLLVAMVVVVAVGYRLITAVLSSRRRTGEIHEEDYGWLGKAICPRCKKSFKLHLWSPRILVGRLERCPHCGKWHIARRASRSEVQEVERSSMADEGGSTSDESQGQFRRRLDESRFEDSQ